MVSVSCFGVRVSVMFHFMFAHYTFSSRVSSFLFNQSRTPLTIVITSSPMFCTTSESEGEVVHVKLV